MKTEDLKNEIKEAVKYRETESFEMAWDYVSHVFDIPEPEIPDPERIRERSRQLSEEVERDHYRYREFYPTKLSVDDQLFYVQLMQCIIPDLMCKADRA